MVSVREFCPDDSVSELTGLLHRAYKRLADMGLKFVASYQDDDVTRDRINDGKCYVAVHNGTIVATVTFYAKPSGFPNSPDLYRQDGVARFGQFAVEPRLQRFGIGGILMDFLENVARTSGHNQIACDTSERAQHLIDYYMKRGYHIAGSTQWNMVNYRSVLLSKPLR